MQIAALQAADDAQVRRRGLTGELRQESHLPRGEVAERARQALIAEIGLQVAALQVEIDQNDPPAGAGELDAQIGSQERPSHTPLAPGKGPDRLARFPGCTPPGGRGGAGCGCGGMRGGLCHQATLSETSFSSNSSPSNVMRRAFSSTTVSRFTGRPQMRWMFRSVSRA